MNKLLRNYAVPAIINDRDDPRLYDINKSRSAIPDKSNRTQEIIKINDNKMQDAKRHANVVPSIRSLS